MINMIVAVSKNGVIGKDGTLPWRIKEDLRKFKELTMGGILFVGKNTAKTLPPLLGREVIVLSKIASLTSMSLIDLPEYSTSTDKPIWIIGGAAIYNAALELNIVDRVYLTLVDKDYHGDTFFSTGQFVEPQWKLVNESILRELDPLVKLQEWRKEV